MTSKSLEIVDDKGLLKNATGRPTRCKYNPFLLEINAANIDFTGDRLLRIINNDRGRKNYATFPI